MPRSVVSACSGPANRPPRRVALSAAGIPSLQIKMRIKLNLVAADERVNHDRRTNQWKWHKGEPDFGPGKILGRYRTDLRADGGTGVHDERNQNVHIAFDGMRKSPVTGGDDDLKQIGADGEMGWNAK